MFVVGIALLFILGNRGAPTATTHVPGVDSVGFTDSEQQVAAVAEVIASPEVKLAPDFTLQRLDGGSISLAQYRDQKPVIIDFWASWCPNCQRDMPRLSKWYDQYGDQVEVIGINLQEKTSVVTSYVDRANISFPIALDPNGAASRQYGVSYTNTHVLINKDGSVAKVIPGDISEQDIKSLIGSI